MVYSHARALAERQNDDRRRHRVYESSTLYVTLAQTLRRLNRVDLQNQKGEIVRYWDCPLSTDLIVSNGRMYDESLDITSFFWDEIYWLNYYFYDKYTVGISPFKRRCNYQDFIRFFTTDDHDSNNIHELCSCKYIYDWLVMNNYDIKCCRDDAEDWLRDMKEVGTILPLMIWDRDGSWHDEPIHTLYHSKCHFEMIEVFVKSLFDGHGKNICEGLVRYTFNNMNEERNQTFWQDILSLHTFTTVHDEPVLPRFSKLLKTFDMYGLNILTKVDVEIQRLTIYASQCTWEWACSKEVEVVNELVNRFGFELLAYPGVTDTLTPKLRFPLLSNFDMTYEVIRANISLIK